MSIHSATAATLRLSIALALGLAVSACSDKPAPAATPAAPPAAAVTAAAEAAANQQAQQQAATLAAMSTEELKNLGRQALREQRIYTPAGNNAMEYYLALRKKSDKPDASAESALMDLQPYAVIAAEQAIGRDDFVEAERLRSLIAAADAQAPSLVRIGAAITAGKAAAAQRLTADAARTVDQAAAVEAARLKAVEDRATAQVAAAAQAAAARNQPAATATPAPTQPEPRPATPNPEPVAAAPAPTPARPAPTPAPARAANRLVTISAPQPAYPPDAQRNGTVGEVVVSFVVNPDGRVSDIRVISARPRGTFDRSVLGAVRRWQYQPIDAPQTVTRTFTFAL